MKRVKISDVSEKQASDIKRMLGVDVSGYINAINTSKFKHIEKRHGEFGENDTSMSNLDDLARISYIMKKYDSVDITRNKNGEI